MTNKNSTLASPDLRPDLLVTNILAGLSTGIILVVLSLSLAALIFSGDKLGYYLPNGVAIFLISTAVVSAIVASFSTFAGMIALPQQTNVAVIGLFAASIATQQPDMPKEILFATVVATMILNSVLSGFVFILLGQFNLGALIRYIPYPVVGGFGTGAAVLVAERGIKIMTGIGFEPAKMPKLLEPDILMKWIPGLIFGLALFYFPRWYKHFLTAPAVMTVGLAIFYLQMTITGTSLEQAVTNGWLLKPIPQGPEIWNLKEITIKSLNQADWSLIFPFIATLAAIWLTDAMMLLLNCSNIELGVRQDINLNQELKAAGIATLASAIGGGIGGYQGLSQTNLSFRLGARGRQNGWIAAGVCLGMLLFGGGILSLMPTAIIGGILIYLSWGSVYQWFYLNWFRLSRIDYFTFVGIVVVVLTIGYLQGVAIGIFAAAVFFIVNYSRISVSRRAVSGKFLRSNVLRNAEENRILKEAGDRTFIMELQGFIFFGTANKLLTQIREYINNNNTVRYILLDFRLVNDMDGSGVVSFSKLKQIAQKQNLYLLFTNISSHIKLELEREGCLDYAENSVCLIFPDLDRGLQWCEEQILNSSNLKNQELIPLTKQLEIALGNKVQAEHLISYLEAVDIKFGEYLFHQGDAFNGLYLVGSGKVSVVLELGEGQTKRIRTYTAGNTIGEMGLYRKAPRMASVVADENSRLYFLSTEAFEKIEIAEPILAATFHKFIVNLLAERLNHREEELQQLLK